MQGKIEQEIKWEVGQEVWDTVFGKGCVWSISTETIYPVLVKFYNGLTDTYDLCGKSSYKNKRSLFFSEPVITAERFPPKKPFVPTFQKGDTVVAKRKNGQNTVVFYVKEELEGLVASTGSNYSKELWNFYKLGEEIKFN